VKFRSPVFLIGVVTMVTRGLFFVYCDAGILLRGIYCIRRKPLARGVIRGEWPLIGSVLSG